MPSTVPKRLQELRYEEEAQAYLRSLPLEHFMESTAQAMQRLITTACLALVAARRPDFLVFSELLVLYPLGRTRRLGKIVPDNMVVLSDEPIEAGNSFNIPLEPARPFWVMEYVSKGNRRKDYEASFRKYERELKVPYYLTFYPDNQELTLHRHNGRKYVTVKPNDLERYAIPEVDIELRILDGWVRFWYQGKLLPLPAEMQRELDETRRERDETRRERDQAQQAAQSEKRRADDLQQKLEAMERELAQLRAHNEQARPRRRNGS
jgi:Uma2 family endonuclease